MARPRSRSKYRDNTRWTRKKVSILSSEKITYVDWKDYSLLRRFMSERAKIRARRVTGNSAQQQKAVADAIKVAREMALLPYANRVTTQRQKKDRTGRRRASGRVPKPATPPPGPAAATERKPDGAAPSRDAAAGAGAGAPGARS